MKIQLVKPFPFPSRDRDFPIAHEVMRRLFDDGSGFNPRLGVVIEVSEDEIEAAIKDVAERPPEWANLGPPPWPERVLHYFPSAEAFLEEVAKHLTEYGVNSTPALPKRKPGAPKRTEDPKKIEMWLRLEEYEATHPNATRVEIDRALDMPPRTQRAFVKSFRGTNLPKKF